jgi:hypothetical protein
MKVGNNVIDEELANEDESKGVQSDLSSSIEIYKHISGQCVDVLPYEYGNVYYEGI